MTDTPTSVHKAKCDALRLTRGLFHGTPYLAKSAKLIERLDKIEDQTRFVAEVEYFAVGRNAKKKKKVRELIYIYYATGPVVLPFICPTRNSNRMNGITREVREMTSVNILEACHGIVTNKDVCIATEFVAGLLNRTLKMKCELDALRETILTMSGVASIGHFVVNRATNSSCIEDLEKIVKQIKMSDKEVRGILQVVLTKYEIDEPSFPKLWSLTRDCDSTSPKSRKRRRIM